MLVTIIGTGGFISRLIDEIGNRSRAAIVFDKVATQAIEILTERAFKQLFKESTEIRNIISKVIADIGNGFDFGKIVVHEFCDIYHKQTFLVVGDRPIICCNDRKNMINEGSC